LELIILLTISINNWKRYWRTKE